MRAPPRAAELVADFANTLDIHAGTDTLSTPDELAAWLRTHALPTAGTPPPALHDAAVALRAGIRAHLGTHVGDPPGPEAAAAADEALTRFPVHITVNGTPVPAPGLADTERGIAELALAWSRLTITGEAARLKRCAEHTCHEAFWDTSKNRSKRWCSMQGCGNRAKARTYAARRAAATG